GVPPERINEIADDYRFRIQRSARKGVDGGTTKAFGLNPDNLKTWRAERAALPQQAAEDAAGTETAAPAADGGDAAWWDGLQPGARKALLAAANVKRSEKSTWDKFSKAIKAKLAPLRAEMEGLEKAKRTSQGLDAALETIDRDLDRYATEQEVYDEALARASETMFPDHAEYVAEQTVERWKTRKNAAQVDTSAQEAATPAEPDATTTDAPEVERDDGVEQYQTWEKEQRARLEALQ